MSRKKRKKPFEQVQASARAIVSQSIFGNWRWWPASRHVSSAITRDIDAFFGGRGKTREECVEEIRICGFGAYTCEGKTYRLRSRYVAGDRPPP